MLQENTILKSFSVTGQILLFIFVAFFLLLEISLPEGLISIIALGIGWTFLNWKFAYKLILIPIAGFLLPPIISFVLAIIAYSYGQPQLRTSGLMRGIVYDYKTRLPYSSSGCIVSGLEFITDQPYNKTLLVLTEIFGFSKSSYRGDLPTPSDAKKLILEKGTKINTSTFPNIKIPSINGHLIIDADSLGRIELLLLLNQRYVVFYDYSPDVIIIGSSDAKFSKHPYVIIRSMKNQFMRIE